MDEDSSGEPKGTENMLVAFKKFSPRQVYIKLVTKALSHGREDKRPSTLRVQTGVKTGLYAAST